MWNIPLHSFHQPPAPQVNFVILGDKILTSKLLLSYFQNLVLFNSISLEHDRFFLHISLFIYRKLKTYTVNFCVLPNEFF